MAPAEGGRGRRRWRATCGERFAYSLRLVTSRVSQALAAAVLGAVLLFSGACASAEGDAAAAPLAAAGNTAEICRSGGDAARTVVTELFTKVAAAAGDSQADLATVYRETFGKLRDQLTTEAGRATDPKLAAVLTDVATEAGAIASAPDPAEADTAKFQAAMEKLETFCPSSGASGGPGVVEGAVGAAGSGCELPVTFDVPAKWKPKAVEMADDDPLAVLASKGPYRMVCEIDAKPAGEIGFLRVWLDRTAKGDPREALKPFVTEGKARTVSYGTVAVGGGDAVDAGFEQYQELTEEYVKRRALAVPTPAGMAVIELGGLDTETHEALLPAYDLAVKSLQITS